MCGIAGIFSSTRDNPPSESLLQSMIQTIAHRGPNGQKTHRYPGLGMAHARLSIIDLSTTADQPMIDVPTGNTIVFNGEIYNYLELREELIAFGHAFQTHGDTEVILKAYLQWGVDCVNHFNGMWAFALYDTTTKTLFAARDRLGVKPFVYGITPQHELVFASEAKALLKHFPTFQQINTDFLTHFIEKDFFACYNETFYKGLFNLLPGHFFVIKHGESPQQKRYWQWVPKETTQPVNEREVIEQFKALLIDSIKLRFRSDVPVGACLSGGVDSGTIVGLASSLFNQPLQTFSCIYPSTPEFDESRYIKDSSKKFGSIAHYIEPTHDNFIELIHRSIYEQDGPTGGPSILSQRAVMELASKRVPVLLDGQGADELLGGYHGYFTYKLRSMARHAHQNKSISSVHQYIKSARAIKTRTGSMPLNTFSQLLRGHDPVCFYASQAYASQLDSMLPFETDPLNSILLEHVLTNLTNLLHYEDRNSMAFSIESRLPFLDYRLVEFAFTLGHEYKIRGSTTKWILLEVAKEILPSSVLNRKDKMGFTTPAHKYFLEPQHATYFARFITARNPFFATLSPSMQTYLTNAYNTLFHRDPQSITPAQGGDMNALWRLFTATLWAESM